MMHKTTRSRRQKPVQEEVLKDSILRWSGLLSRSSLLLASSLLLVLVSGLSVVNTTHRNRVAFNELQELRDQAVQLDVAWGQLLIEQSTFGVEGRIERKAAEQLQLEIPDVSNIVMVRND